MMALAHDPREEENENLRASSHMLPHKRRVPSPPKAPKEPDIPEIKTVKIKEKTWWDYLKTTMVFAMIIMFFCALVEIVDRPDIGDIYYTSTSTGWESEEDTRVYIEIVDVNDDKGLVRYKFLDNRRPEVKEMQYYVLHNLFEESYFGVIGNESNRQTNISVQLAH
ncbi:hypothetical protein VPHK567_0260 [Vibrio phage K567]